MLLGCSVIPRKEKDYEADALVKVLRNILQAGFPAEKVCVLTAYVAQRDKILRIMNAQGLGKETKVDTVDGYQGNESDLVLFSIAWFIASDPTSTPTVSGPACVLIVADEARGVARRASGGPDDGGDAGAAQG